LRGRKRGGGVREGNRKEKEEMKEKNERENEGRR
jgi:hypothetical protein